MSSRISQKRGAKLGEGANLLFGVIFAENCMKIKKMDWKARAP